MRILMLTSSWPLFAGDYRGSFVCDLAADLAARGIMVDVAVPAPDSSMAPAAGSATGEIPPGVVVHWLPALVPVRSRAFHGAGIESNLLKRPLAAFSLTPTLLAYAAECALIAPFVDVIVSNWLLPMGAVGAALSKMTGRPHLVIAHSAPPPSVAIPPMSAAVKAVVRNAASVACVSESVLERTAAVVGPDLAARLKVIHLGIDLQPVVSKGDRRDRPFTVMFAGRLVALKGVDILLRALRGVQNCRAVIVGDGPEAGALRSLAALLGVETEFCGAIDRTAVRRRMSTADIVVIPSRRSLFGREEGLPRVLMEAWSAGVPVVASGTGGMMEVIGRHGGGRLFEPGDVGDLRRLIVEMAGSPELVRDLSREAMKAALAFEGGRAADAWADWISGARS